MQKIKIIVDGVEPTKNEINAKQNFSKVCNFMARIRT